MLVGLLCGGRGCYNGLGAVGCLVKNDVGELGRTLLRGFLLRHVQTIAGIIVFVQLFFLGTQFAYAQAVVYAREERREPQAGRTVEAKIAISAKVISN